MRIVKEKNLMKSLIRDKTLHSTKKRSLIKMQKTFKTDNCKISALRSMQGFKKSQMAFKNEKKQEKG